MRTLEGITKWCHEAKTTTLKRHLPRMVEAFNAGAGNIKLHYAYHEDGEFTWTCGWSEQDYYPEDFDEEFQDIEKVFEYSWLIGKKKQTVAFRKAQTYTAECAVFLFKVSDLDIEKRISKLIGEWSRDYKVAVSRANAESRRVREWAALSADDREKADGLSRELRSIFGTPNSYERRMEIEKELEKYPSPPNGPESVEWTKSYLKFGTVEDYVEFKSGEYKQKHKENETTCLH